MNDLPATSPFVLMSSALLGLLGRVGGWHLRGALGRVAGNVLVFVLYRRISMCRVRMERLIGRYLAGTLRARVVRVAPASLDAAEPGVARGESGAGKRVWPGRLGWLLQRVGWEAGQHAAPLRHALESPEMQALLRDVPQAARILGPVCRMLAIERSAYQPGFVPKARPSRDPASRPVRKRPAPLDWGRTPIPRGVKTWIKRERQRERWARLRTQG